MLINDEAKHVWSPAELNIPYTKNLKIFKTITSMVKDGGTRGGKQSQSKMFLGLTQNFLQARVFSNSREHLALLYMFFLRHSNAIWPSWNTRIVYIIFYCKDFSKSHDSFWGSHQNLVNRINITWDAFALGQYNRTLLDTSDYCTVLGTKTVKENLYSRIVLYHSIYP